MISNHSNQWLYREQEKNCALDLDDTLSYSIEYWLEYLNNNLGTSFGDLNKAKNTISYNKYRELKHLYRTSGTKKNILPRKGAQQLTKKLKDRDYNILIMTARPFREYKCLYKQTVDWLDNNNILFDAIVWGKHKHLKVLEAAPNIEFMVEDHRYNANLVGSLNKKVYLLDNKYNQGKLHKNVIRIKDLMEVVKK